jgi:hypothetical protein
MKKGADVQKYNEKKLQINKRMKIILIKNKNNPLS